MPREFERVTLPSGRAVGIVVTAAPDRPWDAIEQGRYFIVRRERRGDRGVAEIYSYPTPAHPIVLNDLADAQALASALNANTSRRFRQRQAVG